MTGKIIFCEIWRRMNKIALRSYRVIHTVRRSSTSPKLYYRSQFISNFYRCVGSKVFLDTGQREVHSESVAKTETQSSSELEIVKDARPVIEKPVPHEKVIASLQNCSSIEEQMMMLCSMLSLSPEDIKERLNICNGLNDMIRPFFHDARIQLFGSSVNGFGCKGCDLDMVFRTSVKYEDALPKSYDDSVVPSIEDVLLGKVTPMYMSKLSSSDQLLFIHTVFLDYYKDTTITPLFIKAYVPIIRFYVDKYDMKCDLSTGNRSAIANTKLFLLLSKFDERVLPLVTTLRYWGKHVELIGGGLMFNSYTVSLLVIYFLQSRTPPVLPPIDYILSQCESLSSDDVFDENLLNDVKKIPPSKNTQTLAELLREFFFYYLYFNFKDVICPAKACSVPRHQFTDFECNKRFRVSTICVQDPIKLSHNVASLVEYKQCRKFGMEMLYVTKLFQDKETLVPKSDLWGLTSLFEKPTFYDFNLENSTSWKINIPVSAVTTEGKYVNAQMCDMTEAVLKLLQHGLLFKCAVMNSFDTEIDTNKDSDIASTLLLSVTCSGEQNTWLGRNSVKLGIPSSAEEDPITHEHHISEILCKQDINDDEDSRKKRKFKFICNCYVSKHRGDLTFTVKLLAVNDIVNPVLAIFLKEYLPHMVPKVLQFKSRESFK